MVSQGETLLKEQREIYVSAAANLNMRQKPYMASHFVPELATHCTKEVAQEMVRLYYSTGGRSGRNYITPEQLTTRLLHFDYESQHDHLAVSKDVRHMLFLVNEEQSYSVSTYSDRIGLKIYEPEEQLEPTPRRFRGNPVPEIQSELAVKTPKKEKIYQSLPQILAGQVIYYSLPPILYETKKILSDPSISLERFFKELKRASKGICNYAGAKLEMAFINVLGGNAYRMFRQFWNEMLDLAQEAVGIMVNSPKQLSLSTIYAVKTSWNPSATPLEKVDALTLLLTSSITSIIIPNLMKAKNLNTPGFLLEPMQLMLSVVCSHLVLLILEEAKLFEKNYGFLLANLEELYSRDSLQFRLNSQTLYEVSSTQLTPMIDETISSVRAIEATVGAMNYCGEEAWEHLSTLNELCGTGINFQQEWRDFCEGQLKRVSQEKILKAVQS